MKVKRPGLAALLAALPLLFVLQACPDTPDPDEEERSKIAADPDYEAKSFLRSQYMDVYYYWRDEVVDRNAALKPYDYEIYDFFDEMLYRDDRWSWMCDKETYVSDETGVISGTWGVSLAQAVEYYGDYSIRVRYIYPGSPLEPFGVTRGAVLTHIDGRSIEDDDEGFTQEKLTIFNENYYTSPQTFTFRLADGRDTTFRTSWATSLQTRPSLIARVIRPDEFPGLTEPVGYFHYLGFKANFLDDIHGAMKLFHDEGVRQLIIDLRYNGGGDARASQLMMDYLAPQSALGKNYVVRHHSSYLASLDDYFTDAENTTPIIDADRAKYTEAGGDDAYWTKVFSNRFDIDRMYFITGAGTASASEMVINGLRPYVGEKLQMVGDTTYGKPNGMYVLMYPGSNDDYKAYNNGDFTRLQWVFLPICFFNQNSLGESIPWDGFIPDNTRPDDLYHDFGVEEGDIKACLTHLVTGAFPAVTDTPRRPGFTKAGGRRGYRIDLEEDSPRYGLDLVQKRDFGDFFGKK